MQLRCRGWQALGGLLIHLELIILFQSHTPALTLSQMSGGNYEEGDIKR